MADNKDKKDIDDQKKTTVTITLTSKNVKTIESFSNKLINNAKEKNVKVRGPIRYPIKKLTLIVRKSPCGEGSKTWGRYELSIFKRVIGLECTPDEIKGITDIQVEPGLEIELAMGTESN
jgi:small subunit ribosomal protein S20e